jgi:GNAT superfamily N-acetyltransferase
MRRVRLAEPGDETAVARVHVRAWQTAYRDLLPATYLDALKPEDRAPKYDFSHFDPEKPRTVVATNRAEIEGFAATAPAHDETLPRCGEVCALYVDPACWNQGVGRALIDAARSHLASSGFAMAVLWVLTGNERAGRFYRADGWRPDWASQTVPVLGITVNEIRYTRLLTIASGGGAQ